MNNRITLKSASRCGLLTGWITQHRSEHFPLALTMAKKCPTKAMPKRHVNTDPK
jgi:hypothetical protein